MAKPKKKNSRSSHVLFPKETLPAVSVIIPLYNAERYIGDCLDSILAQTFQNFEVIVVDDCSTDSSCAVVESYKERFDGRLTLTHTEENSGSGGPPRNCGMIFSRGEYISFVDADDMLAKTALEEFMTLAKDFDADVVWTATFYETDDALNGRTVVKTHFIPDKPMLETDSLPERIKSMAQVKYKTATATKFVRRNLILEHRIFFPAVRPSEDDIFSLGLLFFAKKILLVPNMVYIRRRTANSTMRTVRTPLQAMNFWLTPCLKGLKALDEMMSRCEFLIANPQYRYAVLEMFTNLKFHDALYANPNMPPHVIYEAIKQEFGKNFGEHDVLICALSTVLNQTQKNLLQLQQQFQVFVNNTQEQHKQFNQFAEQVKAREEQFRQFFEHTQAQYKQFNEFAAQAQARIAYLEAELQKRQT